MPTSPTPPTSKAQVRRLLRQGLAELAPADRQARGAAVAERVVGLPEWQQARTIMLYLSLPDEVDTSSLFTIAFEQGKVVAVPRIIDPAERLMAPVLIRSLADDALQQAHFGVRVPAAEPEEVPTGEIGLVLVPGLGFSRGGERIGRGMGYYDRFLARPDLRASICGLGFEIQLRDALPTDDHDRRMDLVVTDRELIRIS